MLVESPRAPAQQASMHSAPTPQPVLPGFDERWADWQERGAAHDRGVRRKMAIAAPITAVAVAVLYVLFAR